MSDTINIFPTKIYKTELSVNTDRIFRGIRKLQVDFKQRAIETNHGIMQSGSLTYGNAMGTIHTLPDMAELTFKIIKHLKVFWIELGYSKSPLPSWERMWFNTYKKNSFVSMHNHSPASIVGCYYLNKTDSASNIHFLNPNEMLLKTQPFGHKGYDEFTFFEKEVEVYSGDLVLFPGYLKHRSSPVSDNSKRITIAFNFML